MEDYITQLLEILFRLVVLSIVIERALFFIFDVKTWRHSLSSLHKSFISALVSVGICWVYKFDIVAEVIGNTGAYVAPGTIMTGLVVAGGSAAAMRLMQDVFKLSRTAREMADAQQQAQLEEARARRDRAAAEAAAAARAGAAPIRDQQRL